MLRAVASARAPLRRAHARNIWSWFTTPPKVQEQKFKDKVNYNDEIFEEEVPSDEIINLPRVTANTLESYTKPPTKVKMLVRDYIEDSLYNPNYGYFPKQATIFTSADTTIPFNEINDMFQFDHEVTKRYSSYGKDDGQGPGRQIWHTPTELFKPHYGHAVAHCLVNEYLLKYFPYEDLVIYEIGAGNGTLALNILDFIRDTYPEVYERTSYHIVEISGRLAKLQRQKLLPHHPCVTVTHKSIFHWDKTETSPCFFVAMEVIDNFAHDLVRWDLRTLQPYQGVVTVNEDGDFGMHYERVTDPLVSSTLSLYRRLNHKPPVPAWLAKFPYLREVHSSLIFAANLSPPEYIPTRMLSLLRTLRRHFPRHRLVLSDFASLPDTIPGINAPVVQTRFRNTTVPTSKLLVHQGYFDIFFPTDFERLRNMYEYMLGQPILSDSDAGIGRASPLATSASPLQAGSGYFSSFQPHNRRAPIDGVTSSSGLPVGQRKSSVFTHAEFLETYADLSKTRLRSGENPMLEYYKNVKFLF